MHLSFGTDGWREVMAERFTFPNVRVVSQAIALYLRNEANWQAGVVVGHDCRFQSDKFAEAVAEVLAGNSIRVYLVEKPTPTPVLAVCVRKLKTAGAVVITASHNPPEYNGVKFIPDYAGPALPHITEGIEGNISWVLDSGDIKWMSLGDAASWGLVKKVDPKEDYIAHIKELVDEKAISRAGLSVIADPMYGAGYDYLGDVLEEVGCRVKVIHGYRDPLFGGGVPDPTREELAELARVVDQEGAHLGVALDGDGDRFGIIDRGGFYLNANQVLALALYHLVKNRGLTGGVARTVATTHMLDRIAEYYGLRLKETPVGFKYIGQALHEQGFLFGGEESGGLSMLGHVPEKDGLLAALLMVEMVAVEKRPLREVWAEITEKFGPSVTKRIDLPMRAQDMPLVKEAVGEYEPAKLAGLPVVQRVVIDGTKLILSDGSWALVRASGTEPVLRVYIEAGSEAQLGEMERELREDLEVQL